MSADLAADEPSLPFRAGAMLLAAFTFAVYLPALGGGFLWDDPDYVSLNLTLRSFRGLWQIWTQPTASPQYYPLVFSGFWLEYHLWGLHTFGYHTINVLLHITSALLIWRIVNRLQLPGGWLAAAIFALHPINVESVAWISERKNVLSTVFYLTAALIYLRPFTWRRWTIAMLLFIAALLSKSVTASWPAAMFVIFAWRNRRITIQDVARLLPFFALSILSGVFTAYIELAHVGASAQRYAELNFSIADRILIAGRAVWFYLAKLIVPWPLSFIYPRWNLDPHVAWQWIFPLLAIAGCFLPLLVLGERAGERVLAFLRSQRKSKTEEPSPQPSPRVQGEGEMARGYFAAAALFVGTLAPALGFINVYPMRYSFVADHFTYLATPALIVPVAVLLVRRFGSMSAIVLIPLALLTAFRTPVFSGPLPLWSDTYAKNPDSWMVCTNLANAFNAERQYKAAGELFVRAYELSPELYETQTNAAIVFAQNGQTDRAVALLESSARLNPKFPITYFNWGQVLQNNGDLAGAIGKYETALQLQPEFPAARQRLTALQLQQSRGSLQHGGDSPRQ